MVIVSPEKERLSPDFVFSRRGKDSILRILYLLKHFIRPADSGIDSSPDAVRPARQSIGPPHYILMLPHPVCVGISDLGSRIKIERINIHPHHTLIRGIESGFEIPFSQPECFR